VTVQELIVGLIVAACTVYAVWVLMPSALRRALAGRLQDGPWPAGLARHLRRTALAPTGCGCDAGCDAKKPAAATQPIQIHRRPRV
jgi:hypothetical protein